MTITLHGYLPDKELHILAAVLREHGITEDIVGVFTDDTFESVEDVPANIAELIGSVFAPTPDAVRESRARAKREELFAEYDKKVLQYQREVRLGVAGAVERLAAWDAYAEALRAVNDTPDWYKNPQWPPKPEV